MISLWLKSLWSSIASCFSCFLSLFLNGITGSLWARHISWCRSRFPYWVQAFPQRAHKNGFSPLWRRKCSFSTALLLNSFLQPTALHCQILFIRPVFGFLWYRISYSSVFSVLNPLFRTLGDFFFSLTSTLLSDIDQLIYVRTSCDNNFSCFNSSTSDLWRDSVRGAN